MTMTMTTRLTTRLTATLLLAGFAALCAATEQVCRHGNQERIISVEYEQVGKMVPCRVKYVKPEGTQYPWNAQGQVGYCEEKAALLTERQRGWGWVCTAREAGMSGDMEMSDDMEDSP